MSDKMTPVPFGKLMEWILEENKSSGTVFGIRRPYRSESGHAWHIFGGKLERPFGAAAGPHTQLAQNIIAGYYAGGRFFELKTVQTLDGDDLPVSKPCIKADDECYNVEWSTELYVPQALEEYVKAWVAIHIISKEFGLGASDGFQFNMSVGYDLEGIKSKKIDEFIEGLKDANRTQIFRECLDWLSKNISRFENVTLKDIQAIPAALCNSVTLSTLHGCPPQEIERIAGYLLAEKHLHTLIKCNPTILGFEYVRSTLDRMGYDYITFGDFHFKDDLQYEDAVPMLKRLMTLAGDLGLEFGVKLTNTLPVDVCGDELPGKEMYMSGRALFPLSMSVAEKLSKDFGRGLRMSYSGGADCFNIEKVVAAGIFPVTMATTLLKPGGYQRMKQIAGLWTSGSPGDSAAVDAEAVSKIIAEAVVSPDHVKTVKMPPTRKIGKTVPLIDCFTDPCRQGCPIGQDTTAYISLVEDEKYKEALEVIIEKNPLPFITGTICSHNCMSKCTRNFYESPVNIRKIKLEAAQGGFFEFMKDFCRAEVPRKEKAAVVGGGPAGLAAAYFLAKKGIDATIFEKSKELGGMVRDVIPEFRISGEAVDNDISVVRSMGVRVETGKEITSLDDLRKDYDHVILALGASEPGSLQLGPEPVWNAVDFLRTFKQNGGELDIGRNVAVVGGGNTAMDTARAAKRVRGVETVTLVYRRTKRDMPADEEEISLLMNEGIVIRELLSPVEYRKGSLVCRKMKPAGVDQSGRRGFEGTEELVEIEADTVIAATGEQVPKAFYLNNGIQLNDSGHALVDPDTLESSVKGVYVVGDGLNGPATVVEAIRDATIAAGAILKKTVTADYPARISDEVTDPRKGVLKKEDDACSDCSRCLYCGSKCENCVDVCPNRANVSVAVPGMSSSQIIHLDYLCNECGNCKTFCPYESAPYLDKLTLFASEADFENSSNSGFVLTSPGGKEYRVRIDQEVFGFTAGESSGRMSGDLCRLIPAVAEHYPYLLMR